MNDYSYVAENYDKIKEEIACAARLAGTDEPRLVCVTKSASHEEITALVQHGAEDIAENRVQMFLDRYELLSEKLPRIHLIGQLQTNKVKYIVDKAAMIHSLDRLPLAEEISKRAAQKGTVVPCLIEINSGREENKGGVMPEDAEELIYKISALDGIALSGIMTMAPICDRSDDYRRYFSLTREIFEKYKGYYRTDTPTLSMGMSHSYREAIMEGANLVRIGRALFEKH